MDVCELDQALQKSKNKNGAALRAQTREVTSRYRSPAPTASKRCPSPNAARLSSTSAVSAPKRATSAERKRPSRPSSPPSTPAQDTSADLYLSSRKTVGSKLPESLWPSTMRSLSVSFQSDTYSIPISKREKMISHPPSDRTLRPSSNGAHRQPDISVSRKPTPERKRSPLKGRKSADQSENSKPVDSLHSRLVDQHRWPSRTNGKVFAALSRSIDLGCRTPTSSRSECSTPYLRRLSLDGGVNKPLLKSTSGLLIQISNGCSVDDSLMQMQKPRFPSSSDGTQLVNAGSRAQSPSLSRGVSPSRAKPVNPSSRGSSPARGRPSSPSRQPQSSTSVLSFIADIKKGMKVANHIEDVHQLRILYNRHLQWRYANARTCAGLQSQRTNAEKMLYSVWVMIADLCDTIMEKRNELQHLRFKLKLSSVVNNQLTCLDKWDSIEGDHVNSLTWAIQDLLTSTIRIPIIGGVRGDVETVKAAVCAAVDVMQSMESSLFSIHSRVEGMNSLVSDLADVAAQQRTMLDECESVLGYTAAMQ
ncbi:hypothetical protein OROGR_013734 [Orobanche gracilis]